MAFLEYNPTQTLYQFCSLNGFRKIIASKVLWCTDLESGNDPRELALGYEHLVDAIEFMRRNDYQSELGQLLTRIIGDVVAGHSRQQAFCACFSLVADALPMWREYGDNYCGVSIGFRPTAIKSMPGRIQKVSYLNPATPDAFRRLVRDLASNFDPRHSPEDNMYWLEASTAILSAATALKHHSWEYEKEIRFVFMQAREVDPDIPISKYDDDTPIFWEKPLTRGRENRELEYKTFPFGLRRNGRHDASRAIARVVLGPRCAASPADLAAELRESGFEGVEVAASECQIR